MTVEVFIPLLSMSVSEGTIVEWLVPDGAQVTAGQLLYSIETEKAVTDIEAPESGTLRHLADAGQTLPVGTKIAEIT